MDELSYLILFDKAKHRELRLTASVFRDVEYIHLRWYYQNFDGEFVPSSDGVSFPVTIEGTFNLLRAAMVILSKDELETILEGLKEV